MMNGIGELRGHEAGPVWHPYTQHGLDPAPLAVRSGKGALLYLEDGRVLIDGISSWWVNVHGHAHPRIVEAIASQSRTLEQVIFSGCTHKPAQELAERLAGHIREGAYKVFYSDNGSTAVEVGLKMAIQYHHLRGDARDTIVALSGGFHGETLGALSAGDVGAFKAAFAPYLFRVEYLPSPADNSLARMLEALDRVHRQRKVAALLFEPLVQGAGGMRMYDPAVLSTLLERCRQLGIMTIADEVMTGFYRTGSFLATDQADSTPDIICLAKGLSGGFLPLGATMCREEIYRAFLSQDRARTFFHGHSFTANPIACAAGVASLQLFGLPETQQAIARISRRQAEFAQSLMQSRPDMAPRSTGTILALDFPPDGSRGYLDSLRDRLYDFFLHRDILLRPLGNTVYVLPPYCISDAQLDLIYGAILEAVETLGRQI